MPIFGDYETVGEPVAVINLQGHVSTVYKAQKAGAPPERQFIVKCYTPYRQSKPDATHESLNRDRGLEFLEGIKQLKKVQGPGARCLLPIHDLGIAADGVWYVTDYYPRGSLLTLIGRRAKVDSAGLKQIVSCILAGCLALKKSRGYPHGNLKASNVFLAGKPQPLPRTAMIVADPFPAAPLQLARLGADDRHTVDELIHQVTEVQDLHALGEIILQLVERRQVRSGYDYNYPIVRSDAWDNLGKDGDRWRQVCNELLNPQLSLAETNLESLAQKFPVSASSGNLLLIVSAALAVCLLGGGAYGVTAWNAKRHRQHCREQTQAAQQALQSNDLAGARQDILSALAWEPNDNAALGLRKNIDEKIENQFAVDFASARENFDAGHPDQALAELDKALILKPDEADARTLRDQINAAIAASKNSAARQQALQEQYQSAMQNGQAAYDRGDYATAAQQADSALAAYPNEPKALQLKNAAQAKMDEQSKLAKQYQAAMQSAQAAYQQGDYATAVQQADAALALYPNAPQALQLKNAAQTKMDAQAELTKQYQAAMQSGEAAYQQGDYATAVQQADAALALYPNAPQALQLKNAAQTKINQQASLLKQYQTELQRGQAAYNQGDYATALQDADQVLAANRDEPQALQLKNAAQAKIDEQARLAKQYQTAMQSGQAAYQQGDYATAAQQADAALAAYPNAPQALQLKKAAQAKMDEQASQAKQYQAAMQSAQAAYQQGDYATAVQQANLALAAYPNEPKALQLKNAAQAKIDEQTRLAKQYQTAMQSAQAAYQQGDYATAVQQANLALAAYPNEPKALQLKNAAQAKMDEQAKLAKQYQAAMQSAQNAYQQGDYATALQQANAALAAYPNEPKALQLKNAAQAKMDEQAKLAKQYQAAMQSAQSAYQQGDDATAVQQADAALAAYPNDPKALQLKNAAQSNIDYRNATNDLGQCNYTDALAECDQHQNETRFQNLRQNVSAEQSALEGAQTKFSQGDYSFISQVGNYQGKSKFASLLNQAKPEADVFNQLSSLCGDNQLDKRPAVMGILNDPKNAGFIAKKGFDPFREWVDKNDPVKALNNQVELFKVWFGLRRPSPEIIDPGTRAEAVKLPTGIALDNYYSSLDDLQKRYKNLGGDQSSHLKDIAQIQKAMDLWQ
jgi:hypothetical protein